ncbi:MAG: flagellar hook-length control protein FliK [Rhodoferax sp.]|nr:flagellar hook-length control protein FliK [Rhodoferax sp.]
MAIESSNITAASRGAGTHSVANTGAGVGTTGGDASSEFSGVLGGLVAAADAGATGADGTTGATVVPERDEVTSDSVSAAVLPDSTQTLSLVAEMVAQTQGLTVMTADVPALGVTIAGQNGAGAGSFGPAALPANSRLPEPVALAMLPTDAGPVFKPMVQTQTGSEMSDPPVATTLPTTASDHASAAKHDVRLLLAAQLARQSAPEVALFQPPVVVSAEAVLPAGKDQAASPTFTGVGLSAGTQQVLDRLGISIDQGVAQATAVVADTQVAETVSYWVTQGVHNAELTLDGVGGEPVAVHIELDGDQAQVDFRSDQPQVRQMLEAASAQLKSLLLSQGLQLSGVSVGSFGQGGHPSDARASRPPTARLVALPAVDHVAAATTRVAGSVIGGALDMYV